jgi:hypothetical protein
MRSLLLAACLFMMLAVTVSAASLHFVGRVSFEVDANTLSVSGKVAGLGNQQEASFTLDAVGQAYFTCFNQGGNAAPGQNPVTFAVSDTRILRSDKNGSIVFDFGVTANPSGDPAVLCPNANWRTRLDRVEFSSATLTIVAAGGTLTANWP